MDPDSSEVRNTFHSSLLECQPGGVRELIIYWNKAIQKPELFLEMEKELSGGSSPIVSELEIGLIGGDPHDLSSG